MRLICFSYLSLDVKILHKDISAEVKVNDGEYWIVDNEINPFVFAWMPFPKAYRGGEQK